MQVIQLTQDKTALVCDCHYDLVKDYKWCYAANGYAVRRVGGRKAPLTVMHRIICPPVHSKSQIDHINENKLDNRCSNLRSVTKQINALNRGRQANNHSGYKGVSWNKPRQRWQTQLHFKGKRVYSAMFKNIDDAAREYNVQALKYHGEYAKLNHIV